MLKTHNYDFITSIYNILSLYATYDKIFYLQISLLSMNKERCFHVAGGISKHKNKMQFDALN